MSNELRKTQRLPTVETIADIHATDPLGIFTHRTRVEDLRRIPLHKPARQWRVESLDRLLADVTEV